MKIIPEAEAKVFWLFNDILNVFKFVDQVNGIIGNWEFVIGIISAVLALFFNKKIPYKRN
jgi:hypothetical protein